MSEWVFVGDAADAEDAQTKAIKSTEDWWARMDRPDIRARAIRAEQRTKGKLAGTWSVEYELLEDQP